MSDFAFTIENDRAFALGIDRLGRATDDFRVPFLLIQNDFHRSNRKLFTLQNSGLYTDLKEKTKRQKQKKGISVYPILVGETRKLATSILGPRNFGSVATIRKQELILGSSIDYGKFHQDGTKFLPVRKFVFIDGGPADKSSDSNIAGRRERWLNIMNDHVLQLIDGQVLG